MTSRRRPRWWTACWFHPVTWVVLAALARLALLVGLFEFSEYTVIAPGMIELGRRGELDPRPDLTTFLQQRHQYRSLTEDEECYDEMARNLVAGRGFVLDRVWQITIPGQPAMYAGCTYPLFVAACYRLFGTGNELPVYLAQIALHSLAAAWVFLAARRVAGPVAGALAALYYSFHPLLIWSSVALMSESLVVPLVALLGWAIDPGLGRSLLRRRPIADRARCLLLGALLSVLCLTRSTFAYFAVVVAGLLVLEGWRRLRWSALVGRVALYGMAFVLVTAPWAIRNYVHYHKLIPFSTKQGCNAYVFNHDGLTVEFGSAVVTGKQPIDLYGPEFARIPTEIERDAKCMELFRTFLREHPDKFAGLTAMRFAMALLPTAAVAEPSWRITAVAWYIKGVPLVLLPLALLVARRRFWWRVLPWLLLVAYHQAIQSISGPGLRHRLSADPTWTCLVGVAAAVVLAAWWPAAAPALRRARHWVARPRGGRAASS